MELVLHNLTFNIFKCIHIQSLFTPHSKNTVSALQTSTIEFYLGEINNKYLLGTGYEYSK